MISSNCMTKLLKKGHQGIVAQLCSLDVQTSKFHISPNLQRVINKHSKVFECIPKGIPPIRDFDHAIHLILGSVPPTLDLTNIPIAKRVKLSVWWMKC